MVNGFLAGAAGGAAVTIVIEAVDKYSKTFAGVNKGLAATGAAMTAIGAAGLAVSKGLVNTAASFETAFTGVRKTVELTEEEFAKLRGEFKELSKEIPVSFQELSSIAEIAGQLGVEGVDNLKKFTKVIADISATTNLTSESAATSFARIANVMQLPLTEVDKMGAAVVDLGNNFATTEGEIVSFAERISGAGNIAGLSTQDILAIGTAMSSVGIQAEAGGTAVQKVLINMTKATRGSMKEYNDAMKKSAEEAGQTLEEFQKEAGGQLNIFAKTAGLTAEQFQKLFQEDASQAFELFVKGLGEQGNKAFDTLDNLELKDVRLNRAFLSLANAGDLITDTLKTSNTAWEENTALVDEADKRYKSTESQVVILRNKFDSLKDQMGQTLIPTFIKLVDVLGKVFGWLEKHPTLTKFAVASLAIGSALAVVVGPLLMMVALLPAIISGFSILGAILGGLGIALIPITLSILAIVAGLVMIKKIFDELSRRKRRKEEDRRNISVVDETGTILLNPTKKEREKSGIISLNDFILTSNGKIIKPSPQDTIIGTKTPESLGGNNIVVNIDKVQGVDAEEITEMMAIKLNETIRR